MTTICTTILALDLATATGWALLDALGRVTSGVQRFELGRGESPGMRFLRFRRWLAEVCAVCAVCGTQRCAPHSSGVLLDSERARLAEAPRRLGVIAFERAHHRGGAATQLCAGLQAIVLEHAALIGAETAPVHTATLKKLATGSGRAEKGAMVAAARAKWPGQGVEDDNQADALWVLEWARREVGS